jgi:hypothetical protein
MQDSTQTPESLQLDFPAKTLASQDAEQALKENAANSSGKLNDSSAKPKPKASSSKTSRVSLPQTLDEISESYSQRWLNSGIVSHGECLMLRTSESPKDAVESSLLDILQTETLPEKYFLSATASLGIIRRSEHRGRELPPLLRQALEHQAGQ